MKRRCLLICLACTLMFVGCSAVASSSGDPHAHTGDTPDSSTPLVGSPSPSTPPPTPTTPATPTPRLPTATPSPIYLGFVGDCRLASNNGIGDDSGINCSNRSDAGHFYVSIEDLKESTATFH